jgi:autotransporter-associated beta strand protein
MRAHLLTTIAAVALLAAMPAQAQDAMWLPNPGSNFNTPANWSTNTVPTGTAFFGASSMTSLTFSELTPVGGFTFNAGAPPYSFSACSFPASSCPAPNSLTFNGAGITNNSGSGVQLTTTSAEPVDPNGRPQLLSFTNNSTAGTAVTQIINNGAVTTFANSSTAGSANIVNINSGFTSFSDTSTAGSATITSSADGLAAFSGTSNAGTANITVNASAFTFFINGSSAASATITNNGTLSFTGTSTAGAANITNNGGFLAFSDTSTAGAATIINNGSVNFIQTAVAGTANITNNAELLFTNSSSAENATVHTTGGALTQFLQNASGGQARFITDAGGTFDISNTVVPVTVGSIEGAGLHLLGGSQLVTGLNNLSTTVSGEISGIGGSLVKTGSGTLMLSGINSYTGQTIVQAGALIVDGSIAPSSLTTVQAGALLGGSGTVGSTTIAGGGTFAPGPSGAPGTMTVAGNLAFQSNALYLVQVNPTAASTADVTGTATLAGTVQANFAPGSYLSRSYTILSAADGRTGTFDALTTSGLPAGFQSSLTYTGTTAVLSLTAQLPPASGGNVGTAIANSFNAGVALPPAFVPVFAAPDLSPLTGEAATGAQKVGFQLTDQFLNLMLDPFVDGRSGVGGADHPALGFAPERPIMPPEIALAYAAVFKAPPKAAPVYEPRWTVWGGAYGGSNRTTGDPAVTGSHDLSARTVGVAGGLDYRFTPDTVVGLAFAGGGTDWKLSQGLGRGKSDAFQAGIYGATKYGPAYLAAAFAFANHWMSTDRLAFDDHLTADFNAQSYGGRLEGGYRFGTSYGGITPYAAIQAQSFHTPGYTETGLILNGFALTFNGRNATDTRSELGARFDRVLAVYSDAVLALRGRVAWAHDWVSDPTLTPLFQALPGASFIVNGATLAQNSALASAGGELRFANGITLLAKFDGEFASHSSTYGGTGTFRYRW